MVDVDSTKALIDSDGRMTEYGLTQRDVIVRLLDRRFKQWEHDRHSFAVKRSGDYAHDVDSIFAVCAEAVQVWYEKATKKNGRLAKRV